MSATLPTIKLAAVQASSVFLDLEGTVAKACSLIREAGRNGARVIGFPEAFIPGHPLWYHFHPATAATSARMATDLFLNSVEVPSPAVDALAAAARDADAYVVMGICERRPGTSGTMFNSQLFFAPDGRLLGKHQKLVPTVGERLVHTGGWGDTLGAYDTDFGRLSGLICGENTNPLAIFALMADYTSVHVASWPNGGGRGGGVSRIDRATLAGQAFAVMSKAFVINACSVIDPRDIDRLAYTPEDRDFLANEEIGGGSSIVGPDSRVIAGPLGGSEEGILYADADLEKIVTAKIVHDYAGHYNRADVFELRVNTRAPSIHRRVGDEPVPSWAAAPHEVPGFVESADAALDGGMPSEGVPPEGVPAEWASAWRPANVGGPAPA